MGRPYALDVITVEEVMTRNVITVPSDMPIAALEIMFEEYGHMGYPIVEKDRLVGIVTLSDVQKVPSEKRGETRVIEIASKNLIVAYPDETMREALDKMYKHNVGRLPVVERNNPQRIVGIISKKDILRAFEIATGRIIE
ncbi:MAG: CBS domain-containing protein [Aigarchaeota archaeon]|nr:CBS domain-containing protein [Candidatus Pelearchaeum maunauluense]